MQMRLPTRHVYLAALTLLLAACASGGTAPDAAAGAEPGNEQGSMVIAPTREQPTQAKSAIVLPDLGPAPAWSNQTWINSEQPLLLPDLRGKVVLLEFWTFG